MVSARARLARRTAGVAIRAAVASSIVTLAAVALLAQQANVTGSWRFSVTTTGGTGMPTVTFKQDGEAVTGHYSSETLGEADFKGTVKGNAIRFTFNTSVQGQQVDVVYEGTVDKDTMKGSLAIAAGQVTGTFTGQRD
jgi:hypothetical protein